METLNLTRTHVRSLQRFLSEAFGAGLDETGWADPATEMALNEFADRWNAGLVVREDDSQTLPDQR